MHAVSYRVLSSKLCKYCYFSRLNCCLSDSTLCTHSQSVAVPCPGKTNTATHITKAEALALSILQEMSRASFMKGITLMNKLLGIVAIVAILIFFVMGSVGPGSRTGNAWNYLATGNTAQQNTGNPQALAAPSGSSIVGGPSLSAQRIDTILSNAGSPAAGSGAEFVLDSAQYQIDDSVALAFFKHESSFGLKGAAIDTHSIGNINCTPGYSCIGRFRSYSSWSAGIDDWYRLISGPAYAGSGLTTLSQIIPKYAPASDGNSESSYIQSVQADVANWRAA